MLPDPAPLPMPSLPTLCLAGLAAAGVLLVKWWKRRVEQTAEPTQRVIEARPVIHRRVDTRDVPWVDVP